MAYIIKTLTKKPNRFGFITNMSMSTNMSSYESGLVQFSLDLIVPITGKGETDRGVIQTIHSWMYREDPIFPIYQSEYLCLYCGTPQSIENHSCDKCGAPRSFILG